MILILVLAFIASVNSFATGVDLNYWNSNVDEMHLWTNTGHLYYINPYQSGLSEADLTTYTSKAYSNWNSATGITGYKTTNQSSANVDVLGFTRDSFRNMGFPNTTLAVGFVDNRSFLINGYYLGSVKNIYKVTGKGYLYFVWDNTTVGFTNVSWTKLMTHEMGHIFGYIGHYNTNGIMKTYFNDINTTLPSNDNINHIGQIYW